ncbi:MAG TPA: UvrD-helicase domain-containing protein [Hyphomicrobiaceae bacterium]|nr:UvrD-helicase domain-containing protein [Hyphomicrobiaceae bacterium]
MATNRKPTENRDSASTLFDELPFDLPEAPAKAAKARAKTTASTDMPSDSSGRRSPSPQSGAHPISQRLPLAASPPPPLPPRHDPAHDPVPEGEPPKLSISARALQASGGPPVPPYLEGLNPEQRAAVEALDGPVLVLAGAGTGKTRVLTTRIAHILATGRAWPSQVLAVTFTNKAAREMKERIGHLVGGAVEGMPWLGTFHSIGVKILRRHAELVGLKPGFTILDTDDQLRLIKQVIEAANLDKDRWPARQLASHIDGWKNRGLTPDKVPVGEAKAIAAGKGAELYAAYQRRLKDLNACDFGDLLLEGLRLFLTHPDVLQSYQKRFRFILVDEYQDTNTVQYLWLRLLAQGSPNICCVGDDDQSIYGWRGAEVDNILRFETDFPGASVIRLERNYRSTSHILAAASGVIAHNTGRLGKTLFTDGDAGDKVTVTGVWDDEEEARAIGEDIEALQRRQHRLDEISILVRASFQMRVLEDRFVTLGLPYRVIGGPRFYERQEIKDAIAYLDTTLNQSNDLKFERIINVPKRGIGDTSVKRVVELSRARQIPLFHAAREIVETEELAGKARKALTDLVLNFERWRGLIGEMRHTELAELILDESGYTAMWQADKSPQAQSRLENLKELIRFMDEFDTLEGFLEHISLVMDVDQGNDGDRVSLMTLHAAKGLEFDTVFLPGWEEGLFPSQRSLDENGLAGLEEERRLAYVGITRAKKNARISFAQNRRNRGLYQSAIPSRFVDELPEANVEVIERKGPFGGTYQNFGTYRNPFTTSRFDRQATSRASSGSSSPAAGGFSSTYDTPGWQRAQKRTAADWNREAKAQRARQPLTIEGELVASSSAKPRFEVGERVFHLKFGNGEIVAIDGNKLTIAFDKAGEKRVMDSYVERIS